MCGRACRSFRHSRLLDLTAVTLTVDRRHHLAAAARSCAGERVIAHDWVITRLGASRQARWVASRWERWCDIYAVPAPANVMIWWEKKLAAPFSDAAADDRVTGALPDAAGPGAAGPDTVHSPADGQDVADLALLGAPWKQVLLPARSPRAPSTGHIPGSGVGE